MQRICLRDLTFISPITVAARSLGVSFTCDLGFSRLVVDVARILCEFRQGDSFNVDMLLADDILDTIVTPLDENVYQGFLIVHFPAPRRSREQVVLETYRRFPLLLLKSDDLRMCMRYFLVVGISLQEIIDGLTV